MHSDVVEVIVVVSVAAGLLGFAAAVLLTCISLAKTRLVSVISYVTIALFAVAAVVMVLSALGLTWRYCR